MGQRTPEEELIDAIFCENPEALITRHDDIAAVPRDDPRRKVGRAIDLLLACLIVIVPVGLLHFVTAWGETDTISLLVRDIERGRWAGAVLNGAVLLLCGGLPVWLVYALLRAVRLDRPLVATHGP